MTKLLKGVLDSLPMPNPKEWGGKRRGAGRKPLEGERQEDHMVSLTAKRWVQLDDIGDGNYSLARSQHQPPAGCL